MVWLHGTLYINILEARNLANDSNISLVPKKLPGRLGSGDGTKMGRLFAKAANATENAIGKALNTESPPDCYAVVSLHEARIAHTHIDPHSNHPRWGERFIVPVAHDVEMLTVTVKDKDVVGTKFRGKLQIAAAQLAEGQVIEGWFMLMDEDGLKPMKDTHKQDSMISVVIQYQNVLQDASVQHELPFTGLDHTFFPARGGCRMHLYKDAHVDHVPEIPLAGGRMYRPPCCWIDLYNAICAARHFIYVTGWSVFTEFKLVRDPTRPNNATPYPKFGELLKAKAAEGVRVLCMVWDDRTSVDYGMINTGGVMGTHDEETRKFFVNSGVTCVLFPREGRDQQSSILHRNTTDRIFTHHQKTVLLDVAVEEGGQHGSGARQLTAFLGGIDVTNGRYDTGRHSLFRTLEFEHSDDLHQPCIPGAEIKFGGPREPWHDIHCQIQGPAAWDVMTNFEQRWARQGKMPQALLELRHLPGFIFGGYMGRDDGNPAAMVTHPGDPELWRCQIFRSIDSDSADGFPASNAEAARLGLDSNKGRVVEFSIQKAYINAIRQAEQYIYIENQYFLGSSHCWEVDRHAGATHLVPIEIALKVVSKINDGERFMAYIVIPLFPEGIPESGAVQEILHWQCNTVRMMYGIIGDAIQAKGIEAHPTDYLQFFAPGNREALLPGERPPAEKAPSNSGLALAQLTRRHMIYVHSKMMITDDEYIVIGSANINQRSMDGSRDSEIAVGGFQPYHVAAPDLPRGDVHGFRMALWEEHTGIIHPSFYEPASMECVLQLRSIGQTNWEVFAGDEVKDMPGHLMLYPYAVDNAGVVTAVTEFIPDTKKAKVLGTRSISLPCPLTT